MPGERGENKLTGAVLGLIIDSGLDFNNHLKAICKKPIQKLTAITRMAHILFVVRQNYFAKKIRRKNFRNQAEILSTLSDEFLSGKVLFLSTTVDLVIS